MNFDHQRAIQILEETKEIHIQMIEAMQEANKFAEVVGKLELKLKERT